MASLWQPLAALVLAGVSASALLSSGCSGNTVGDGQTGAGTTHGGSAHTAGTSQGGKSGSGAAGSSSQSGAAAGGASAACGPGCMQLCEGGLCDCFCQPTCTDFARPAFDKSCAADDDCFAGVHTEDCCGSKVVLGYNVSEKGSFDSYEAECLAQALCRCAPAQPTLEGGQVTSDLEQRSAVCSAGQCLGTGPVNVGGM